jgi:hypothetical protein
MGRTRQRQPGYRYRLSIALVVALFALVVLAAAGPAVAGPPGPTLDLAALQAKLDSGPLDGYMLTTMHGSTPQPIPVTVLAVVEGFSWGKLIMFESTDKAISDIGGIAAGMSGSPIYVDDNGTDKLVGAVSYGDDFTLRGTGLATPIEYMTSTQELHQDAGSTSATRKVTLDQPVRTATGVVKTVVLAANEKAARATTAAAGQTVMHPLGLAEIGGISPASKAYKTIATRLEKSGLTVVPAAAGSNAPPSTPSLEAGSPCGVLFSNGFYWLGALGTVTYRDAAAGEVMLFGHPVLGDDYAWGLGAGPMQGTLTGAVVDAVWPSSWSPYKMMTPGDAKGTAIQDRSAGVLAKLGDPAPEYPVTTTVTVDGGAPVVDTTNVTQWFGVDYAPGLADENGLEDPGVTGYLVSAGLYHALDSDMASGSGTTTTTVEVHDATGSYVVTRDNIWDADGSWNYLGDEASFDAAEIFSSLVSDPYGLRDVHVDSVAVTASLSSTRLSAGLVNVHLKRALRPGDNDIAVDYYRYGSPDLQTMHVTLTIPAGTRLNGYLDVLSATEAASWGYYDDGSDSPTVTAPETLQQVADRLTAEPTNGDLLVDFSPSGGGSGSSKSASTIAPTDRVFTGEVYVKTRFVEMHARPGTIDLGQPILLRGWVDRAKGNVKVDLYVRGAGMPEPTEPTQTVTAKYMQGSAFFTCMLPPVGHNEQITAEVPAYDNASLPGAAIVNIKVRPRFSLAVAHSAGVWNYTATVKPKDAGGSVRFQRWTGGHWVTLDTIAVDSAGKARIGVAAKAAPKVRARFLGSDANAASTWVVKN